MEKEINHLILLFQGWTNYGMLFFAKELRHWADPFQLLVVVVKMLLQFLRFYLLEFPLTGDFDLIWQVQIHKYSLFVVHVVLLYPLAALVDSQDDDQRSIKQLVVHTSGHAIVRVLEWVRQNRHKEIYNLGKEFHVLANETDRLLSHYIGEYVINDISMKFL